MAEEEEPRLRNVTQEELEAAVSAPAVWVNKTLVTGVGPTAKLVFLETRSDGGREYAFARAAVLMNLGDLLQLRDLINGLEEQIETIAIAPMPPPPSNG